MICWRSEEGKSHLNDKYLSRCFLSCEKARVRPGAYWNSEWEAAFTAAAPSYPIGRELGGKGLVGLN